MFRFACAPSRGFLSQKCAQLAATTTSSTMVASSSPSICCSPRPSSNKSSITNSNQIDNIKNNNNVRNGFNSLLRHHLPSSSSSSSSSFLTSSNVFNKTMFMWPALASHSRFCASASSTPSPPIVASETDENNNVINTGAVETPSQNNNNTNNNDAGNNNHNNDTKSDKNDEINEKTNDIMEDNNVACNFWFCDELVQHVMRELPAHSTLAALFMEIPKKVKENVPGENPITVLLEEMTAQQVHAKLRGTILDIAVVTQMKKWENNNNNNTNNAAASNESFLLGTLCFLNAFANAEHQLVEPNVVAERVARTDPYKDFDILCSRLSIEFTDCQVSQQFTALINSTIKKCNDIKQRQTLSVSITERIKQRHYELKKNHEHALGKSPEVSAQADLLEKNNCWYSCSWNALITCTKRFTSAPVGLRDQFARVQSSCQATPGANGALNSPSDEATNCFLSDCVNIVAGPSGSGKTISTLLAAPKGKNHPLHNILIHVDIDCCERKDVSSEKSKRNLEATAQLLRGILSSIVLKRRPVSDDDDDDDDRLPRSGDSEELMWKKFYEMLESSSLQKVEDNSNEAVRIVVDEIGKTPLFLRGLCSVWREIRLKLAEALKINSNRLELVVVGTGAESFQMSPPGSMPTHYKLFIVNREKLMFEELFKSYKAKNSGSGSLVSRLYEILVTDAAKQTDPIVKAIIRMSKNARCGAIILSFIDQTANNFLHLLNNEAEQHGWHFDQARAVISGWCPLIAAAFASKNGLGIYSGNPQGLKYVLGCAIGIALNRDHQLVELPDSVDKNDQMKFLATVGDEKFRNKSNIVWKYFGVRFGLLYDTAERIPKSDYCGTIEAVYDVVYGVDSENNNSTDSVEYYYIVRKGHPRFMIDEAFVTMFLFLSQSTSTGVFSIPHRSTDLLFEEANWDFARVAAQFGKRVSSAHIAEGCDRKTRITPPHLLYGLGATKVYSQHLSFQLDENVLHKGQTRPPFPLELNKSAAFWRKVIQDENAACVLLNGDSAQGADMIVLAKRRIIMTQCKNTGEVDNEMVHKEVKKMRKEKLLELLCWIVADDKHLEARIAVFYVIAGRESASFTTADPDDKRKVDAFEGVSAFEGDRALTRLSLIARNRATRYDLFESVHATHAGLSSGQNVPPFYPILQSAFPRQNDGPPSKCTMIQSCVSVKSDCDVTQNSLDTFESDFSTLTDLPW